MRYILLSLLLVGFLASCSKKDEDVDKPTAELEKPADSDVVYTADGIRLVGTLTDNTGLLQYKLTIEGLDSLNGITADSMLSFVYVEGVLNEEKAVYLDDVIELSEATFNGHLQAILTCLDIEGNESVKDTVNFEVINSTDSEPPVFNVSGPTPNDTLHFGQGFPLSGQITDDQALSFSSIYVGRTDMSSSVFEFDFENIENNMIDYSAIGIWLPVDSTWAQGAYQVYYIAWDKHSAVEYTIPFHVSY